MNSKSIATMKNLFTRLMLVAVAAMGFVACQNGLDEVTILPNEAEKVTISITTESETESRTAIDEANKSFVWSAGDKIMVFQDAVAVESAEAVIDGTKATFEASFEAADGTFVYNAIYPSSAYIDDSFKLETTDVEPIVRVATLSTQTSTADSYDPEADLLIAQPTSATQEEATTMSMSFKRLVAIGKMTLKGLNTDEPINSVTISAPGKVLAGRSSFNYATGQVVEYGYNSYGESSLTIKYEEALTNNSPVFFTCLPCEFVAGDTFTVSAVCGDTTFTRVVTIPEGGNSLLFTDGDLTTFTVNMSSATETSSFSVDTGDYVIMVQYTESSTVYNKMMKVNNSTSTTAYQYYTDYTGKTDVDSITTDIENIWTITNNGNGTYYIQPKDSEYYLSWRNGGNTACLSTDALALRITENGDYVKIVVNETAERVLSYNSSSPRFAFYKGTQKQDLLLIPAEVDSTPYFEVTPNEQSISADEGSVVFTVNPINNFTATVTATTEAEWLEISNIGYTYTATASANTGATREAIITFSAEGYESVSVVITQSAKPADVAGTWTLVTNASDLKAGDVLIFYAECSKGTFVAGDISSSIMSSVSITVGDEGIINLPDGTVELTLGGSAGAWTFSNSDGKLLGATAVKKLAWGSGTTTWAISIAANGDATIQNGTDSYGRFLYNVSSPRFTTYTSPTSSSMLLPQIYKKN